MDGVLNVTGAFFSNYWDQAVTPLHHLSWQTFTLFAGVVLLCALIGALILRYSWRMMKPTIYGAQIRKHAHKYDAHLRMSPADYRVLFKLGDGLKLTDGAGSEHVSKNTSSYYLVTLVETQKRRPVLYREMKLQVPLIRGRVKEREIQLDASALTHVRLTNGFEDDDDLEAEISSTYDVYIRRVRFYDVRHWLLHPVREIRTVVWVTLITTTLPTLIEVFFG